MSAQVNSTHPIQRHFFRRMGVKNMATAKVLAAWEETKPYFPPGKPFGRCTKPSNSGLKQGLSLWNNGLQTWAESWSEQRITKATPNKIHQPRLPYCLNTMNNNKA